MVDNPCTIAHVGNLPHIMILQSFHSLINGLRVLQTKGAGARGGQQVAHQARLAAERWHYKAGEAIDTDAD